MGSPSRGVAAGLLWCAWCAGAAARVGRDPAARPQLRRRRRRLGGGKTLGVAADAAPLATCAVAPYNGSYAAGAPALPLLAPVVIERWMVEAARRRVAKVGCDTQDRCVAVGADVVRLAAPNVFIAGWSRSGTTSLRTGLSRVPRTALAAADVGTNPAKPGEGLYFKGNGGLPYADYLRRAHKLLSGYPTPRAVPCDDAGGRACVSGGLRFFDGAADATPAVFIDKTPDYHTRVEVMLAIHYASPRAKLVLSTRHPWNFAARVAAGERRRYLDKAWGDLGRDLRAAGCPRDPRADFGTWRARGCAFAASPFARRRGDGAADSETATSYFKLVHYVYAVDLFRRLFGEANVHVLRFERCLGRAHCGPALAAFLGLADAAWILPDPYAEFRNVGEGTTNLKAHEESNGRVLHDPNATMAALGFAPSMVEDVILHERLLHDLLGWAWDWGAADAADAAPNATADEDLRRENDDLRRENDALRRNTTRLEARLGDIAALATLPRY